MFQGREEITTPPWAKQARYGAKAGQPNPRFLNAKLFNDLVLTPYREVNFNPHTGPFLFKFQRHSMSTEEFCSSLDTFFGQLPTDFRYAAATRFYQRHGFMTSPIDPMTVMITVAEAVKTLGEKSGK